MGTKTPFATEPSSSGNGAETGAGSAFLAPLGASASITSGGTANIQVRLKAVAKTAAASTMYIRIWVGE